MELPRIRDDAYDEGGEGGWDAVFRLLHAMQAGRAHAAGFERAGCWRGDEGWVEGPERSEESGGESGEDSDGDSDSDRPDGAEERMGFE